MLAGVSTWLPLVAFAPLQLPEAVQPVASLEDQLSVAELPTTIEFADSDSVGAAGTAGAATLSVTVAAVDGPTELVQVKEYG